MKLMQVDNIKVYRAIDEAKSQLITDQGQPVDNAEIIEKNKNFASYLINTKRPYYSNNVSRDPLFSSFEKNEGMASELGIPVLIQGTVVATIHFLSIGSINFSQDSINMVMEILNTLRKPINNIKMFLSAKKLNETLLKKIAQKEKELQEKSQMTIPQITPVFEQKIINNSQEMKTVLNFIEKIAPTDSNILILGESGTGKELIARKVHCLSPRQMNNYVIVNCGAIQETLLESEFFGHEKGSFTGAIATKLGLVEKANNGTLFLDEVGELSAGMQTKLLRFLEQREAYRVGGMSPYRVNVRIIAATNRDLKHEVEIGRFREDLYYRLNTITVTLPSLRERKEDIIPIANYFLNENKSIENHKTLTPGAANILKNYRWPGNIRELKNVMERVFILNDSKFIDEFHLSDLVTREEKQKTDTELYTEMTLSDLEKRHIVRTLDHLGGNKTKTAKALGITVKTLYNKLHSYGMIQSREIFL
jgi:Nif-specific regulatory protein